MSGRSPRRVRTGANACRTSPLSRSGAPSSVRRRAFESGVVVLAIVAALIPIPSSFVERWFAAGFYPRLQRILTPFTNLLPFAWFDIILVVVVGVTITLLVKAGRQARHERKWRPVLNRVWRLVVAAAGGYVLFLTVWGMNY